MITNPNRTQLINYIDKTFSSPDYKVGLKEFSKSVSSSLEDGEHLLIKAQLGDDGQLGYLIPAVYEAVCHRRRIVVACASEQLKRKLVSQTLPELQQDSLWEFSFGVLNTRDKYLCVRKYVDATEGQTFQTTSPMESQALLTMVENWAEKTKTGDFSELPIRIPTYLKNKISCSDDDCKGKYCQLAGQCHFNQARHRAQDADLVVCDHETLFKHIEATRSTLKPPHTGLLLPKFQNVIIDECTWTEMAARKAFGFRISIDRFRDAAKALADRSENELWYDLAKEYEAFLSKLRNFRAKQGKNCFRLPLPIKSGDLLQRLHDAAWCYAEIAYELENNLGLDELSANVYRRAERECRILQRQLEFLSMAKNRDWEVLVDDDSHGIAELYCQPRDLKKAIAPLFGMATCVMVIDGDFAVAGELETYRDAYGIPNPRMITIETEGKSPPRVPNRENTGLCVCMSNANDDPKPIGDAEVVQ